MEFVNGYPKDEHYEPPTDLASYIRDEVKSAGPTAHRRREVLSREYSRMFSGTTIEAFLTEYSSELAKKRIETADPNNIELQRALAGSYRIAVCLGGFVAARGSIQSVQSPDFQQYLMNAADYIRFCVEDDAEEDGLRPCVETNEAAFVEVIEAQSDDLKNALQEAAAELYDDYATSHALMFEQDFMHGFCAMNGAIAQAARQFLQKPLSPQRSGNMPEQRTNRPLSESERGLMHELLYGRGSENLNRLAGFLSARESMHEYVQTIAQGTNGSTDEVICEADRRLDLLEQHFVSAIHVEDIEDRPAFAALMLHRSLAELRDLTHTLGVPVDIPLSDIDVTTRRARKLFDEVDEEILTRTLSDKLGRPYGSAVHQVLRYKKITQSRQLPQANEEALSPEGSRQFRQLGKAALESALLWINRLRGRWY